MKAIEIRKQTDTELTSALRERQLRREELLVALARKQAKNTKELREVRRDIARIRTILRERQR